MVTKASLRSRVRRQAHLDMVAIKLFPRPGGSRASCASSACSPQRLCEPGRGGAVSPPQGRAGRRQGRPRPDEPCRALPPPRARDLSARRPVPDRARLLLRFALAIVSLADRPRVRVLARPDKFGRFVSLIAYLPKDRTDARLQARIGAYLAEALGGRLSTIAPDYPEGPLARLHVIVATPGAVPEEIDAGALEAGIAELARTWADSLRESLSRSRGGDARAWRPSMPTPSRPATARCIPAPRRCPTSRSWSGSRKPSPGRSTSSAAPATPTPASA